MRGSPFGSRQIDEEEKASHPLVECQEMINDIRRLWQEDSPLGPRQIDEEEKAAHPLVECQEMINDMRRPWQGDSPLGPRRTLEEKKGSSETTLDSTKVYSSTSGSPFRPRKHASANSAPAYAMDRVAEPCAVIMVHQCGAHNVEAFCGPAMEHIRKGVQQWCGLSCRED